MPTKFKKGDMVNFVRSAGFKINNTMIHAVVIKQKAIGSKVTVAKNPIITKAKINLGIINDNQQVYIIESKNGWVPNVTRVKSLQLDHKKKYIFVNQNELTLVHK